MTLFAAASMQNDRSGANLGTLACFATRKSSPGTRFLLSASHVIYEGGRTPGQGLKICSPNSGSCCCTKNSVAVATDPGFYGEVGGVFIDCAIALLNSDQVGVNQNPALAAGAQPPAGGGPNPGSYITGSADAVDGEAVRVVTWKTPTAIQGTVQTGQVAKAVVDGGVVSRPGQLWITVAKADAQTVVEGSGDSGAAVVNRFNQVVGLMWGRGVTDPNSISQESTIIFACPIGPVLTALEIAIPSDVPA
ncbi:MAG TPA: hypothetical protein VJL81_12850, partial [Solirubrobacterales bacterium]|nr:hypothetical protein [Solirubrobacterales bacterium]